MQLCCDKQNACTLSLILELPAQSISEQRDNTTKRGVDRPTGQVSPLHAFTGWQHGLANTIEWQARLLGTAPVACFQHSDNASEFAYDRSTYGTNFTMPYV